MNRLQTKVALREGKDARVEQAAIVRGYHADIDLTRLTSCL
jgi:hypothetical protein